MRNIAIAATLATTVALAACSKTGEGEYKVETPDVDVNVSSDTTTVRTPSVDVGTKTDTVTTPTVGTKQTEVKVPTVDVKTPAERKNP